MVLERKESIWIQEREQPKSSTFEFIAGNFQQQNSEETKVVHLFKLLDSLQFNRPL